MLAFIIRRLIQSIVVMLVVGLIAFVMFRFVGDPVDQMVGLETSIEDRERLRETLGLNAPLPMQFWNFISSAAMGDFGTSYQFKRPVVDMLGDRLPATLELALVSAIFALCAGWDGPVQQVTRVLTSVADVSVSAGRLASALVDRTAEASLSATGAMLAVTLAQSAWLRTYGKALTCRIFKAFATWVV